MRLNFNYYLPCTDHPVSSTHTISRQHTISGDKEKPAKADGAWTARPNLAHNPAFARGTSIARAVHAPPAPNEVHVGEEKDDVSEKRSVSSRGGPVKQLSLSKQLSMNLSSRAASSMHSLLNKQQPVISTAKAAVVSLHRVIPSAGAASSASTGTKPAPMPRRITTEKNVPSADRISEAEASTETMGNANAVLLPEALPQEVKKKLPLGRLLPASAKRMPITRGNSTIKDQQGAVVKPPPAPVTHLRKQPTLSRVASSSAAAHADNPAAASQVDHHVAPSHVQPPHVRTSLHVQANVKSHDHPPQPPQRQLSKVKSSRGDTLTKQPSTAGAHAASAASANAAAHAARPTVPARGHSNVNGIHNPPSHSASHIQHVQEPVIDPTLVINDPAAMLKERLMQQHRPGAFTRQLSCQASRQISRQFSRQISGTHASQKQRKCEMLAENLYLYKTQTTANGDEEEEDDKTEMELEYTALKTMFYTIDFKGSENFNVTPAPTGVEIHNRLRFTIKVRPFSRVFLCTYNRIDITAPSCLSMRFSWKLQEPDQVEIDEFMSIHTDIMRTITEHTRLLHFPKHYEDDENILVKEICIKNSTQFVDFDFPPLVTSLFKPLRDRPS